MSVTVRFAPSPTGYLHPGNVRTALINWLFARKNQGRFILRMDDTDLARSKPEYEAAIQEDLRWLGLEWDGYVKQSDRFARYEEAVAKLKAMGRLYPCYETPEELDVQRKMQASRGLPPIYNRAALKLTEAEKQAKEARGIRPHWRFRLEEAEAAWADLIRGPTALRATSMSDPVLVREDGVPVYTLASVVDDGEMGITHVVRGEDHVSNTAVQIQLYQALGFTVPHFAHMALIKTKEGELSKRTGGNDIRSLREEGIFPMAVNALLARIGTSDPVEPIASLTLLVEGFDWKKFGRAPANYDVQELKKLNEKLLHKLPFSDVCIHMPGLQQDIWNAIRANVSDITDASIWLGILNRETGGRLSDEDRAFARQAAALLPPEPWDDTVYDRWIAALKPATERKGKALFLPLRQALTAIEQGPELKVLLPLLGYEKTSKRLMEGE